MVTTRQRGWTQARLRLPVDSGGGAQAVMLGKRDMLAGRMSPFAPRQSRDARGSGPDRGHHRETAEGPSRGEGFCGPDARHGF